MLPIVAGETKRKLVTTFTIRSYEYTRKDITSCYMFSTYINPVNATNAHAAKN